MPDAEDQDSLLARLDQQQRIFEQATALLVDVATFSWLDEAIFDVPDSDVVAYTFGPLVEDAADPVAPAAEPDSWWKLYSMSNTEGVQLGEKKLGSDFSAGRKYKRIVADAIAYAIDRINVGTVGILPAGDDHSIISPYRVVFRCLPGLDPRFTYFVMKSPFFRRRIREAQVGAVRNELHFSQFVTIPFRVPHHDHQLRVVAQIEEQLVAYQRVQAIADQANASLRTIVGALFAET